MSDDPILRKSANRRDALFALAGAAALLSACGGNNLAYRNLTALRATGGNFLKKRPLGREEVAKFPAASISVKRGRRGQEGLVLLSKIEGRNLLWLSGDRILLVTRGGRLMQTAGFTYNLTGTFFNEPDPVDGQLLSSHKRRSERVLDFEQDYGLGITAQSRFHVHKREPITVLGAVLPTIRVTEKMNVKDLRWRPRNHYWVHEETGVVWRSLQHPHPDFPPLMITTLRPVSTGA